MTRLAPREAETGRMRCCTGDAQRPRAILTPFLVPQVLPAKLGVFGVDPRGLEPLTSAMRERYCLPLVVRLCTWLGRDFTIGMGSAANLARSCAYMCAGGSWPRWCSGWCTLVAQMQDAAALFTRVRGTEMLRTSPFTISANFAVAEF